MKKILWLSLLIIAPAVSAGTPVKDDRGNVVGELVSFETMCGHIHYSDQQAWNLCYRKWSTANSEALARQTAANKDNAKKHRSLEDELNATRSTAAGMAVGDGLSSGYANTTANAAARASLVGKRITEMAQGQSDQLVDSLKGFDGANSESVSSRGTSSIYGSGSAADLLRSAQPPSGGFTAHTTDGWNEAERMSPVSTISNRLDQIKYRTALSARTRGDAIRESMNGDIADMKKADLAAQERFRREMGNANSVMQSAAMDAMSQTANIASTRTGPASLANGGQSSACQTEQQRVSNLLSGIRLTGNQCQDNRAAAAAFEQAALYESRCGSTQAASEYRRTAAEARNVAAAWCGR